jgi:hypothetical protein
MYDRRVGSRLVLAAGRREPGERPRGSTGPALVPTDDDSGARVYARAPEGGTTRMITKTALRAALEGFKAEVSTIEAKAKAEGRDLTPAESKRLGEIVAEVEAKRAEFDDDQALTKAVLDLGAAIGTNGGGGRWPSSAKDIGDSFTVGAWRHTGAAIHDALKASGFGQKALVATGSLAVEAVRDDEIYADIEAPTYVQDLIPSKLIESNNVTFLRQTTRTHLADVVADGATKPTSIYTLTEVAAALEVIAHLSEFFPNRLFEDSDALRQFLQDEMAAGVEVAAEAEAVDALLTTSGIQVQAFDTNAIRSIRKAVTKLRTVNVRPDVLIMNLSDAEALDLTQDAQQRFYFGGPANSGFADDRAGVWSVPVIQTAAITAGMAILANLRQAARRYVRDASGRFDIDASTQFATNQSRVRLERREVTVVVRPFSVCSVDVLTP